jgi:hypothetical protein
LSSSLPVAGAGSGSSVKKGGPTNNVTGSVAIAIQKINAENIINVVFEKINLIANIFISQELCFQL